MPEVTENFNLESREVYTLSLSQSFLLVVHWFCKVSATIDTSSDPGNYILKSAVFHLAHGFPCHIDVVLSLFS